jgi:redox-sensitive bicupin YhaK (pirin superfamily)
MPQLVIGARTAALSTGLNVKRILPFRRRRMVVAYFSWIMPCIVPAVNLSEMDVLPHPHISLSTVTYLLDGQVTHRDSLGVEQIIRPGSKLDDGRERYLTFGAI